MAGRPPVVTQPKIPIDRNVSRSPLSTCGSGAAVDGAKRRGIRLP